MILLILPNQLFPLQLITKKYSFNKIILIEEPRYFTDFKFHKLKLVYHRSSMKKYYDDLVGKNIDVSYIDYNKVNNELYKKLNKETTYYFRPCDHKLDNKYNKVLNKANSIKKN